MNPIRQILTRRRMYDDLSYEIREHLDEKVEELMAEGMSREEASAAARRDFGSAALIEERGREVWQWPSIETLWADLRYAVRQLRKAPAFALTAGLTLALGIGANTAVFSVLNAVVLRPLPFDDPDTLMSFGVPSTRGFSTDLSYPDFFDYRAQNRVFERIACHRSSDSSLMVSGRALHVAGEIVSWDLFELLRVKPFLGRTFRAEEEQPGARAAILSHRLWESEFGGDPGAIGRTVSLDGEAFTVVGVAPAGFRYPVEKNDTQIWTTLAQDAGMMAQRGAHVTNAIARLKPGVSMEQARAQMDTIAAALARQYSEDNSTRTRTLIRPELTRITGDVRGPLLILMGAVGMVLLIACANIANLLLARTTERGREFAVRAAIGASRARIVRQLLAESLVLAALGLAAGIALALACLRLVLPSLAEHMPRVAECAIDLRVLAFSAGLTVATCLLFSLAPAISVARAGLAVSLKDAARGLAGGHVRLRGALVAAQIALGLVLLTGAGLLMASFVGLQTANPGFRPDHTLAFSISLPEAQYDATRMVRFYDRLLGELASLPGVESASAGGPLPLKGDMARVRFDFERPLASPADRPGANIAMVTPGFFHTLGIPVLKGRIFTPHDDEKAAPVLIVNKAFAERFFPGQDAVGKRIRPGAAARKQSPPLREIIGVVGNAKQNALGTTPEPVYYFPIAQLPWFIDAVVLRTRVPPLSLEPAVRATVAALEKQAPVYDVRTMEDLRSGAIAQSRFVALLLGGFAGIALVLTMVGLYGVMLYAVTKRTREIGVRMALGAERSTVLGMVLKQALGLVAAGMVIGASGALAAARLLRGMLHGVAPGDPLLLAVACAAMAVTAAIAAYLPARRAAAIDPMQALRSE